MKTIVSIINKVVIAVGLLAIFGFTSCAENKYEGFDDSASVYFQLNEDNWNYEGDSVVYSFVGKDSKEGIVSLLVNLIGKPADHDRKVRLHVDDAHTTAKASTHYEPLQSEYILKANEMQLIIPVKLFNTDPLLTDQTVQLAIVLDGGDELMADFTGRTYVRILVGNVILKPTYWATATYYLGYPYSKRLMEIIYEICGRMLPETYVGFLQERSYWQSVGKQLKIYMEENYPVYDENGNLIQPNE